MYYESLGKKHLIDLSAPIARRTVEVIPIEASEVETVIRTVMSKGVDIHVGEAESIAAMLRPEHRDLLFCTADRAAVNAAYLSGLAARLISLERCITGTRCESLPCKCTERTLEVWKASAIQRFGIVG